MRKRPVLLALTALGLAFAPSCGDDDTDVGETGTTTPTTAPVEATTSTTEAAGT